MVLDISACFASLLSENQGPVPGAPEVRRPPEYGVSARLDGEVIDLILTFRSGAAYCCHQPGCHLGLHPGQRWARLRRGLSDLGSAPGPGRRLTIRLTTLVEAGARFFDVSRPDPGRRGWFAFAPSAGIRTEDVLIEGDDRSPET